jgi:antitoxin (DNA-binding transcriptional repressor) of toxin-antitoxin stability system
MPQIDVAQAKREFDQLLKRVSQGEEVLIKKDQPAARLTAPSSKTKTRQFGSVERDLDE